MTTQDVETAAARLGLTLAEVRLHHKYVTWAICRPPADDFYNIVVVNGRGKAFSLADFGWPSEADVHLRELAMFEDKGHAVLINGILADRDSRYDMA